MQILVRVLAIASLITIVLGVTFFHAFATPKPNCYASPTSASTGQAEKISPATHAIFINEVLSNPHTQWNCADSSKNAWIEIYNPQNQAIDLHASYAAFDTGSNDPTPSYLPIGTVIAAHSFFVFFPATGTLLFPSTPSTLRLTMAGVVIDQVLIPKLELDQSYGRTSDGGDNWETMSNPTIGVSNGTIQSTATETKKEATATARADITPTETKKEETATAAASIIKPTPTMTKREETATARANITPTETKREETATARANVTARSPSNNDNASNISDSSSTSDSGGSSSDPIAGGTGQTKIAAGLQPTWDTLQFPTTALPTAVENDTAANSIDSTSAASVSTNTDMNRSMLLTLGVFVLALAVLGGWRFRHLWRFLKKEPQGTQQDNQDNIEGG